MNINQFFEHWSIAENPFRGEEARHDEVLARLNGLGGEPRPEVGPAHAGSMHSDFEKILGEMTRPSTSVVFGEKGSGKTAIKLQIGQRVAEFNARNPDAKLLVVNYDDLNQPVAELDARFGSSKKELAPFKAFRLVDHMDAVLAIAVDRLVAALLNEGEDRPAADLGAEPWKVARRWAVPLRHDLLLLQSLYDPADTEGHRSARLRRILRLPPEKREVLWRAAVVAGWAPAAAMLFVFLFPAATYGGFMQDAVGVVFLLFLAAYIGVLVKRMVWDRMTLRRLARRVHHEMRTTQRLPDAIAASLAVIDPNSRSHTVLPLVDDADEPRYAMFERLRRVAARFGYTGILVLVDRVDEPTLVNGDAEKMREIIWPLFNNKFLQQERFGVKLLLPIELRHALFKESADFFQEARLDKQGFIERLSWTGPMLYDLCNARLNACRAPGGEPLSLIQLFAEDVTRQDLVDALDQMHQPRDAFKFLYRCFNEHCSNVTAEEGEWRVPRLVLENVRRAESDRVQQLYRGITPA
jgi:hypothetical protein